MQQHSGQVSDCAELSLCHHRDTEIVMVLYVISSPSRTTCVARGRRGREDEELW